MFWWKVEGVLVKVARLGGRRSEEAYHGGDGAATRRAAADIQRKRKGERRLPRHVWSERPVEAYTHRRPGKQGKKIHPDAPERQDPDR